MRLQQYINEKYLARFKDLFIDSSTEIYVNPSMRDLKELKNSVRFIADAKTKRVYVWNAMDLFHKSAWERLKEKGHGKGGEYDRTNHVVAGEGRKKGRKIVVDPGMMIFIRGNFQYDWSFAEKYIEGFLDKMEEERSGFWK